MISTDLKKVKLQSLVENQLPSFVQSDFPLLGEFLREYYTSQEYPTASADVLQNIDEYVKLVTLTTNSDSTVLRDDIDESDDVIFASFNLNSDVIGTYEFPEKYGLIQIDNEIILYEEKTNNSFKGCIRGFSGVTSYNSIHSDQLSFSESDIAQHIAGATIVNLSALLFARFLIKVKGLYSPGFQNRQLDDDLNQRLFISRVRDFYTSKGSDESFRILFGALYGEDCEVLRPREFLFRPSDADYRLTKDLVVESINGDPSQLLNCTLFQDAYDNYGIGRAYAPITNIEKITYNQTDYYKFGTDYSYTTDIALRGSVYGEFSVHPSTQIITQVSGGSSVIDVDSTIGFPPTGELVITYESGAPGILTYRSKSVNQFYGVGVANTTVAGIENSESIASKDVIRLNVNAYAYVGIGTTSKVQVRIGNVLANPIIEESTYYYDKNDSAKVQSLGITTSGPKVNNWFYNLSIKYDIESIVLVDESDFTYTLVTYDKNDLKIGDKVVVTDVTGSTNDSTVSEIISSYSFSIKGQGRISNAGSTVERKILRGNVDKNLSDYQYINNYFANIQNTYAKFNQDVLVASSSIPNYSNAPLDFYDRKLTLNGNYSGDTFTFLNVDDHGYYTGDAVYYNSHITESADFLGNIIKVTSKFPEMDPGIFFVKRVNKNQLQLATSPTNIDNNRFVSVAGIVTSNTLEYVSFNDKKVDNQLLFREIKSPNKEVGNYETRPGSRNGILINGVEILNYKSTDAVYHGTINNIAVAAEGKNYDIINPPLLNLDDNVGSGATGICAIKGSLQSIDITDTGYDYVSKPIITITGGNGTGAKASVNTLDLHHNVEFQAVGLGTERSDRVILEDNTIGFSTFHKFRNGEKIIYRTDGGVAIGGISTDAVYYVHTVGVSTVSLYREQTDAINAGVNTISLTSFGTGVHKLQTFERKKIVSSIIIDSSGSGYENKKRTIISATGINTALNQINIDSHGYKSGEIIQYTYNTDRILGINSNTDYFVTEVDNDNFRLSSVGVGTTAKSLYYDSNQYIQFSSPTLGSGTHSFNYQPITVDLSGEIGVTTYSGQDFKAKLQPLFKGSIDSIQVTNSGVSYGSSSILNYDNQPLITLKNGTNAEVSVVLDNGKIVESIVTNEGYGYEAPPILTINTNGSGSYGKLVPIVSEGKLVNVRIDNAGIGYTGNVLVSVLPSGSNAKFRSHIKSWTVNLFTKYLDIISGDDGVLDVSQNSERGIQYTHLYTPRKLRESVYVRSQNNQIKYGLSDLEKVDNQEVSASYHSPIIGWAYDGHPIYGPYGYTNRDGGIVRAMESGYKLTTPSNRPPLSDFPQGFFIEDYEFDNSGDLDEHNGRFCVTPDYPNGTYAYFTTINSTNIENSGPFNRYRIPEFPYLIGNTFKSKPNPFNYSINSNQINYDLNDSEWFRNTTPYSLDKKNTSYDFLLQPNKAKELKVNISDVSKGNIEKVGIVTGGSGYQINDKIIFEPLLGSQVAKAKVSEIGGVEVTNVSVASSLVSELEIIPFDASGTYLAISTSPHNFTNTNLVSLAGFNTSISSLQGGFNIGVRTESVNLTGGVSNTNATGLVTYFGIAGSLDNDLLSIRENDILGIGTETIKVLNVDSKNSRLRVLRAQNETVSSAHTATAVITEDSRKFTFNATPQDNVIFESTKEIYFEPKEAVGLGTLTGVGIGTTIFFSNPGAGLTQVYIQSQSIFLPDHELNTGDLLRYRNNGGDSIGVSTDGTTSFNLPDESRVYVGKISNNLIGISTFRVGLGSTGTFVGIADTNKTGGLLRFTGLGTGVYHSFKTIKDYVVTSEATKNVVTVATASTHGLLFNDNLRIDVNPGIHTSISVKYNDFNRRIVFDPKSFVSGNVDTTNNAITITDHGLKDGDKVIHTASTPSGGLEDEKIYYIVRQSTNSIKLCLTRYESLEFAPEVVDITSASAGTISPVNPTINLYNNNTVKFNLSDPSLCSFVGLSSYAAFDFNLYTDKEFKNPFYSTSVDNSFEVSKSGVIGISTNANLTLVVGDEIPKVLHYKFNPVQNDLIDDIKKQIVIDREVVGYNQIEIKESIYSGLFPTAGIGTTTTFSYEILNTPEKSSYTPSEGSLKYFTNSTTSYGGISKVEITSQGKNYSEIVGVSSIKTGIGTQALFEVSSDSIGKINSTRIEDIGFDYPTDNTLRPVLNLPEILIMDSLNSFESIGISSAGKNYTIAPDLNVLDGFTRKKIDDVDLTYKIGDSQVTILENVKSINSTTPIIIPTSNINGIDIKTLSYDVSTKNVTIGLNTAFSDASPLDVGDKVLIENVSVGVGTTGIGYNSVDRQYSLFTLADVNIPLGGGVGVVTYSLGGYLREGEFPGNFDALNSAGIIVPEKYFPQFNIKLKKNNFFVGEDVTSGDKVGEVESWNNRIELLKLSTTTEFDVGDIIVGNTSRTQAKVKSKIDFNAEVEMSSGSVVANGWQKDTGFLNNSLERIADNNYYQNFSYSLKSKVDIGTWNEAVSTLNHPAGFLKFSDLRIESTDNNFSGVSGKESVLVAFINLDAEIDINCYSNFDLVTENSLNISDGKIASDEIYFNSRVLTDYFESVGNRALIIDDISTQFNSDPRSTRFSVVANFDVKQRSKKWLTLVKDKTFTGERQCMLVTLLQDETNGFMNQYGRVESTSDLGSFDFQVTGNKGQLLFYPTKFTVNDYNVSNVSLDIVGLSTVGIGSTTLGSSVDIRSTQTTVAAGTTTTVVGIASTYRSAKVIVQINANNGQMEFDELNIIHDGTTVELLEYGQVTTVFDEDYSGTGLGTYIASMATGSLNIDFVPNAGIACSVDTLSIAMASANAGAGGTGIGTQYLGDGIQDIAFVDSSFTAIPSAASPLAHKIAEYDINNTVATNDHNAAYYLISVEDTTNGRYEMSEVILLNDSSEAYMTEYGNIISNIGLGTVGAAVSSSTSQTQLMYTPIAGIAASVRVFQMGLQIAATNDDITSVSKIDLNNASITAGYGDYTGTETDVLRAFNLTHDGRNIFQRDFDGSSSTVVDLTKNSVTLPEHFYVTGEEVTYSYDVDSGSPIGIATTTISGIGATDQLPTNTFIVKIDERTIKFAKTAEDALKSVPNILHLSSVGGGIGHTITARNQNTKCLIALDNAIQSPIVSTAVTTGITTTFGVASKVLETVGVTSFFGGDLVKVNEEIMKVDTVSYGKTNNILVDRAWMGTNLGVHTANSIVTKVEGNYNIVANTLNFITAPQGPTPVSSTTNPPESRDWVGITTFSMFQGRSFMRTAAKDSTNRPYQTNYVFDDISDEFNGIGKTFTLTSNKSNAAGFSTDNAVVLINGVLQGPTGDLTVDQDYTLSEGLTGISSITFTGAATSEAYDPNSGSIPVGGIIVSVGSTGGLGYQPLVSAGGTAIVSAAGTITSISIGNTGSGYRVGVQTTVNVAIQTSSNGIPNLTGIGTAAITDGHITGIAITNGQVLYVPRSISNVGYSSVTGITTITTSTAHGLAEGQEVKLAGIAFTCDYLPAVGVQSAVYTSTTGIMTVTTSGAHGLSTTGKASDVVLTGLAFTCSLDNGAATHSYPRTTDPAYGGTPVTGVASVTQFTINVGISTVPTFYVSGGTIQPALIAPRTENNSDSGVDPAAQGSTILTILNTTSFTINSGVSTRTHFYSRGGSVNRAMDVVIDEPLSYSNMPLIYSSSSVGVGTQATVDIVVGQGSSVVSFEVRNKGYSYADNQILTIPVGGTTGIPKDPSYTFSEFQITIQETISDRFSAWNFGQLEVLDKIENEFDSSKRSFTLKKASAPVTIRAKEGSSIDVQATLLVFINDILQVPGEGYTFTNGSVLTFSEAPKGPNSDGTFDGDTCKILFYKGSGDIDVTFTDVLETVKKGDTLEIQGDADLCARSIQQDPRLVTQIVATDIVDTNTYVGVGINGNPDCNRTVTWCKQGADKIIDGQIVSKSREELEALINPTTVIIQPVGVGSNVIFVESVRSFFDPNNESQTSAKTQKISITSQDNLVGAAASAVVSIAGTISSVVVSSGGTGYTSAPDVIIGTPVGLGTTTRASVTSTLTGDAVSAITVTSPGTGYTISSPPEVLIEVPSLTQEINESSSYQGDFGEIVGVGTTSVGIASTGVVFDLYIPTNSFLRDATITGTAVTISGIQTGYYFTVSNSNIGNGLTSIYQNGSVLGIGTTFIDNVYEVAAVSIAETSTPGIANTYVARVTTSVSSFNSLSGMGVSELYGNFSWGRIALGSRGVPQAFNAYTQNGFTGLSTSALVTRVAPLKSKDYSA